jgi:PRTRC genetic system ThiF family protein
MNAFDPPIHIKQVIVVGLGGTGCAVARIAARMLYDMRRRQMHSPRMVLIDPDRIEEKNVGRQAVFVPAEIGEYKAAAVGRKLNLALGLDIAWIPEPVNADKHVDRSGSLVLSCVDNHVARRELSRIPSGSHVAISAGNHSFGGQVCIGSCTDREEMLRHLDGRDGKYTHLPHESLLFPQLLEPEPDEPAPVSPQSCSEAIVEGGQSLLINDWMACLMGSYLYALLYSRPITSFVSFVQYGDGMPVTRNIPIEREELLAYLEA